jgi:hypothetical protein
VSDSTAKRIIPPKRKRSLKSKLWIAGSLIVSGCIITWTFSLPLRLAASATQNQVERDELVEQIKQKRTLAEQRREEAFENQQDLVRLVVQKRGSTAAKPGNIESRQRWKKRAAKARKKLLALGDPKAGTIEWIQKQRLLESLEDGPL